MKKLSVLSAVALLASVALGQVPIPPHASVYNGFSRGFNFTAATPFNIVQLELPLDAFQVGDTSGFMVRVNSVEVLRSVGNATAAIATMIPIAVGDVVDVIGNWSPAVPGNFTAHNSYGNAAPYASVIEGVPHTLNRCGWQWDIADPAYMSGAFLPATTGSIGRVNMYTSTGQTGTVFATASSVGAGCVRSFASFYENNASTFDLSNTSLSLQFVGTGYVALPGTTPLYVPTSTPVTMGDDQVLQFPLGWTLPYPGGTTTDLWVSSNGFVNATTNTLNGCCAFNLAQFLSNGPCWAAKWRDLNPSAGGSVYFDTDPVTGTAYITFDSVPDYATTNSNTFQYAFSATGQVELRFGNVAPTAGATGWSPGAANLDPGSIDISATPVIITGATDQRPLALASSPRPIGGTTINLTTSNIGPTAPFGAILLGINNPAFDLTPLGMAGCTQYTDNLVTLLFLPLGQPSAVTPFNVPNLPGLHVFAQSVVYDPAANLTALGAVASQGIDHLVGDY